MLKKILIMILFMSIYVMGYSYSYQDFDDYSFILKFYGNIGLGSPSGPIMDQERNSYSFSILYYDGTIQTGSPYPYAVNWGVSGEYLFDHFGLVLSYNPIYISEYATAGDGDQYQQYSYGGTLISGNSIYAGINYHFPFALGYGSCGSFFLGVKAGYLTGTLAPYISLLDYVGLASQEVYISLKGYGFCPNFGFNFMFGFLNLGISISYFIDDFTASQNLNSYYSYSGSSFTISYLTIDMFVGIAF